MNWFPAPERWRRAQLLLLSGFFSYFGGDGSQPDRMAQSYDVVIWHNHPDVQRALPQMKQTNPQLQAFMYRELFCVLEQETPLEESVGHFAWIDAHRPGWFQRDVTGRRVKVPDYPGRWVMDVGNPEWQAYWIDETLRDVLEGGWDGVFVDDALTNVKAHHLPPLAGYPNDAALQQAVYGFLARATAAFHRKGKLLIANVSNSYDHPGLWEKWLEVTDGLMEEHFAGEGWTWGPQVARRQLDAMRAAHRKGKWMFCMTYGPWKDGERMRASLVAYLAHAGPRAYWSYRPVDHPDDPAWESAKFLKEWGGRKE